MDRKDNPIQGFAVYLEIAKSGATQQVFLIPKGYDSMGREVKDLYFYRLMTSDYKKSLWRSATMNEVTSGEPNDRVFNKLNVLLGWLELSKDESWSLVGKPLVIETSKLDYDDIINGKTPTKLIYRINQSRLGAGFPEEIVN